VTYIPAALRREVIERAANCCEYCRIRREDHILPFEIDHIISEKHGGETTSANLCRICWDCNNAKGSNIASADPVTGNATFLYHPRRHSWEQHFRLQSGVIVPLTPEGRVTVFLLELNAQERVDERETLILLGRYPCELREINPPAP